MNRLVFLDFDGVLNSDAYFARNPYVYGDQNLDARLVKRLCDFLQKHDCSVVVSSSWREGRSLGRLKGILAKRGFRDPSRIVGKTGVMRGGRGREIASYVKRVGCTSFVILDDDDDMEPVSAHLVQTDPRVGLTRTDLARAKKILDG